MESRKTYGQFCGLARALDHAGDRWVLLIVRELLIAPRSFRDLMSALDGISAPLLTARLRTLVEDGLVERNEAPPRSKAVAYRLTAAGAALEPVVMELIRWGARWMMTGPGRDRVDPRWATLALRALLSGPAPEATPDGILHLEASGSQLTIEVQAGKRVVRSHFHGDPRATLEASLPAVLAIAAGATTTTEITDSFASAALTPLRPPIP